MMHFRNARPRTNGPSGLRWTVLPPEFCDILILKESKFAAVYANGTQELYPPWWERKYDGVFIDKRDRHFKVHNVNDDYAPKDGGDLGGDTGVLACMLMQLVENKNLNVDDDFKNKCMKYRRYMTEQYYNWRFIPRG
ncbi:hypothetical protein R6Q57_023137 [Mikania cordata]